MDRFVKRSMEIRIKSQTGIRMAIDSASQSFCDSLTDLICQTSNGKSCILPQLRRYTLSSLTAAWPCQRVLMRTAPLSKRFNFQVYYHSGQFLSIGFVNGRKHLCRVFRICVSLRKKPVISTTNVFLSSTF